MLACSSNLPPKHNIQEFPAVFANTSMCLEYMVLKRDYMLGFPQYRFDKDRNKKRALDKNIPVVCMIDTPNYLHVFVAYPTKVMKLWLFIKYFH